MYQQRSEVERHSLSGRGQAGDPELGPSRVPLLRCCRDGSFDVSCQQRGPLRASQGPADLMRPPPSRALPCSLTPLPTAWLWGQSPGTNGQSPGTPLLVAEKAQPRGRGNRQPVPSCRGHNSRAGCTVGLSAAGAPTRSRAVCHCSQAAEAEVPTLPLPSGCLNSSKPGRASSPGDPATMVPSPGPSSGPLTSLSHLSDACSGVAGILICRVRFHPEQSQTPGPRLAPLPPKGAPGGEGSPVLGHELT